MLHISGTSTPAQIMTAGTYNYFAHVAWLCLSTFPIWPELPELPWWETICAAVKLTFPSEGKHLMRWLLRFFPVQFLPSVTWCLKCCLKTSVMAFPNDMFLLATLGLLTVDQQGHKHCSFYLFNFLKCKIIAESKKLLFSKPGYYSGRL